MQREFSRVGGGFSARDAGVEDEAGQIRFELLFAALRRQWLPITALILVGLVGGVYYAATATPRYTATSTVIIDETNKQIVNQLSAVGGLADDDSAVLSQVELIRSENIAEAVVDKLKLYENPQFSSEGTSPLTLLRNVLSNPTQPSLWFVEPNAAPLESDARRIARQRLQGGLLVDRVGRTAVISISYTSTSPSFAATVAQTFAEAYLEDQLNSKYEATQSATQWMQDRISDLKTKSLNADTAVQKFKTDNNLIDTNGSLISDQQLAQLTAQLSTARGNTAEAQAKYQRIQNIIATGNLDSIVSDALDDPVISNLRSKYLEASRLEQDIASRLGEDHEQAVRLRSEMAQYKQLMFDELRRIAESYQNAYQVAVSQQQALTDEVNRAEAIASTANDSQVQLRELEREADTYRNLYQTFLQQYQQAIQQQSFPVTEARIISKAETPSRPSAPSLTLSLAIGVMFGIVAGALLAAYREVRDRYFRTPDQVRQELGLECLGLAPAVKDRGVLLRTKNKSKATEASSVLVRRAGSIYTYAVDQPRTQFAEAIRSAKIAVDLANPKKSPRTIGVVSTVPGEGKSVIAMNLAEYLAKQGLRTLLIDGDFRNPSITRAMVRAGSKGLADALATNEPISSALCVDAETGLRMLPASSSATASFGAELLSPEILDLIVGDPSFDYIVFDLPPLGPVVDARAIARKIDAFVFVSEWGKTPRRLVRSVLANDWMIAEKCVGVILNKVDTRKLRRYQVDQTDYTQSYYARG